MDKRTLALSLCGLFGCALSSNAAIDVTVNGTEYAITTVKVALTYDPGTGFYNFSYPSALTPALFSTLNNQVWFGASGANSPENFSTAYVNAVQAADPHASIDNALQDAETTIFINSAFGASSAQAAKELTGYDDESGETLLSFYQDTPITTSTLTLAEATVVVPEPATYGAIGGVGMVLASLGRQLRRKH